MICFETERLLVRHLDPDDLDELATLCADPITMQYMGDGETLPREECARWIDICQAKYRDRGYGTSGVFERATRDFIGICGVIRAPDRNFDEIIYAYAPRYWGKGYATEVARSMLNYVFNLSSLTKIYATIHNENHISQRMMAKIGMVFVEDQHEADGNITKVYLIKKDEVA